MAIIDTTNETEVALSDHEMIRRTYEMVHELYEVLAPLKAMAAGMGAMQKIGMKPEAKAAVKRLAELSGR